MGSPSEGALTAWLANFVLDSRILFRSLNRPVSWAAWVCLHALHVAISGQQGRCAQPACLNPTVLLQDGLSLEGLEGEVLEVVKEYQGKNLTANLPYKVQLLLENDGKKTKFFAHLVRLCGPVHVTQLKQGCPELLLFLCVPQPHPAPVAVS